MSSSIRHVLSLKVRKSTKAHRNKAKDRIAKPLLQENKAH